VIRRPAPTTVRGFYKNLEGNAVPFAKSLYLTHVDVVEVLKQLFLLGPR
jgi:hypothetical protein